MNWGLSKHDVDCANRRHYLIRNPGVQQGSRRRRPTPFRSQRYLAGSVKLCSPQGPFPHREMMSCRQVGVVTGFCKGLSWRWVTTSPPARDSSDHRHPLLSFTVTLRRPCWLAVRRASVPPRKRATNLPLSASRAIFQAGTGSTCLQAKEWIESQR